METTNECPCIEKKWIDDLKLQIIPNIGYFKSISENRDIYSTNFILINNITPLHLHKLTMDEQWFYHDGEALVIHVFSPIYKTYTTHKLGKNIDQGEKLHVIVPKDTWFCAHVISEGFNLSTCSLAPAFYEGCSKMLIQCSKDKISLVNDFPDHHELIDKYSVTNL